MLGGIARTVASMATYSISKMATQKVAAWASSSSVRQAVSAYAKQAGKYPGEGKFLGSRIRSAIGRAEEARYVPKTRAFISGAASHAKEEIRKRSSPSMYKALSAIGRTAKDELNYIPANYIFYRTEKAGAVSPEEKERTQNFAKFYFGAPMMTSIAFGAVTANSSFLKKTSTAMGKAIPKRVQRAAIEKTVDITRMAVGFSENITAMRLARDRTFEKQSMLRVFSSRPIGSVLKDLKHNYESQGVVSPRTQADIFKSDIKEQFISGRKKQFDSMGHRRSSKKEFDDVTATAVRHAASAYNNGMEKQNKVAGFMNKIISNAYGDSSAPLITRKEVEINIGELTGINRLRKEKIKIAEGYGRFKFGDQDLNLGALSMAHMVDSGIKRATTGIPGFFTGMFGLKNMLKQFTINERLRLKTNTHTGIQDPISMPISYAHKIGDVGVGDILQRTLGQPRLADLKDKSLATSFLKSRLDATRAMHPVIETGRGTHTRKELEEILEGELRYGRIPTLPGEMSVKMPNGEAFLFSNLNVNKKIMPTVSQLGGLNNSGEYMKFTDFTSTSNLMTRSFRSFMGGTNIHGVDVGHKPESTITDRGEQAVTATWLQRLRHSLDLGYSKDTPMFSKALNAFRKFRDPEYGPTLFSDEYLGSKDFRSGIASDFFALRAFNNTIRNESDNASIQSYMALKQKLGTENILRVVNKDKVQPDLLGLGDFLVAPGSRGSTDIDSGMAKHNMGRFMDFLTKTSKFQGGYKRELDKVSRFMHSLDTTAGEAMDVLYETHSYINVAVGGRRVKPTTVDLYNSMVLDVMGSTKPERLTSYGIDVSTVSNSLDNLYSLPLLNGKELSAAQASGKLSRLSRNVSEQYRIAQENYTDGIVGNSDEIKNILTNFTGSPDYGDVIKYYNKNYRSFGVTTKDYREQVRNHSNALLFMPGFKPEGIVGTYTYGTEKLIDMPIDMFNMSTMTLFHAFNRTASEMLGVGFNEATTRTPGQYMSKMFTKRVIPGLAAFMGYSAIDKFADHTLDGTAFGEGLTVFGANVLAGARLASQTLLDMTGVTDIAKYAEDLLPGSIESPASGLIRGFGPIAAGMAIGNRLSGPTGGLHGGLIGAGIGAVLGGLPLGIFGCLPGSELVKTDKGFKPIKDINVNDKVYTYKGRLKPVIATKKTPPREVISVDISCCPHSFSATGNHGILVKGDKEPDWVALEEITTDDYVAFPAKRRRNIGNIDLMWFTDTLTTPILVEGEGKDRRVALLERSIGDNSPGQFKISKWYDQPCIVWPNKDIGRFIGWYLAEGSQMRADKPTGISLAIHPDEREFVEDVINKAKPYIPMGKVNYSETITDKGVSASLDISGSLLASILKGIAYPYQSQCNSKSKYIHPLLHEVKSDAFIVSLLSGIIDGDGSITTNHNGELQTVKISTISPDLAWDIQKLLAELGIISSTKKYPNYLDDKRANDKYIIAISSKHSIMRLYKICCSYSYKIANTLKPRLSNSPEIYDRSKYHVYIENDYIYYRVRNIQAGTNDEYLYDLEVDDDSSFLGFGVTYHNSWDIDKSRGEIIEELSGQRDVAIRAGRFWELSSGAFEGGRINRYRPHIYHMTRSKYADTPTYNDSYVTEAVGALFPDIYSMKHYHSRPYPATAGLFSNIPIFSDMMHMIPYSGTLTGAGISMHDDQFSTPSSGTGSNGYGAMSGGYSQSNLAGLTQDIYGINKDPMQMDYQTPTLRSNSDFAVGASVSNMAYIVGLRGYMGNVALRSITGNREVFDQAPMIGSPLEISGFTRQYYDLELGGMLGASEIIRRYIPDKRNQIEIWNPLRNTLPDWLPGEEYYTDFLSGDPYCVSLDTIVESRLISFVNAGSIQEGSEIITHTGNNQTVTKLKVRQVKDNEKVYNFKFTTLSGIDNKLSEDHPLLVSINPSSRRSYSQYVRVTKYEYANLIMDAIEKGIVYQKDIARFLNIKKSTVSKICSIMKDAGKIIYHKKGELSIIDNTKYDLNIIRNGLAWKQAKDIAIGDYVAYPKPKLENPITSIDIGNIVDYHCSKEWVYCSGVANETYPEVYEYLIEQDSIYFERGERKELINSNGWNPKQLENIQHTIKYGKVPKRVNRTAKITNNICFLLGLYLAEGSYSNGNVVFSLNINEHDMFQKALLGAIDILGYTPSHKFYRIKDTNGADGGIYSSILGDILTYFCGKGSHTKILNDIIFNLPDDMLASFLRGYIDGDGSSFVDKSKSFSNNGIYVINIKTCNQIVALQIRKLMLRLGVLSSIIKNKPSKSYYNGKIINSGVSYSIVIRGGHAHNLAEFIGYHPNVLKPKTSTTWSFITDNFIYLRVNSITECDDVKQVVGFQIDGDNSFCIAGVATHNTKVRQGEARLPGASYETLRDVDMVFPLEASMMGLSKQGMLNEWIGAPEHIVYRNRAYDAAKSKAKEIEEMAKNMGTLSKTMTSLYNAEYDMRATVDMVLEGRPTRVVPKGFGGESDLNSYLIMADVDVGMLYEVDPESGGVTEKLIKRDMNKFQGDIARAGAARAAAMPAYKDAERDGKAINMAKAYSWFDRYRILADVAQYSAEFREADAIVQQQIQAGNLTPNKISDYYMIQDQIKSKQKAFKFDEYRFLGMGDRLTQYGQEMDKLNRAEYNPIERTIGAGWEYATHLRNPLQTKLYQHRSAMEAYEQNTVLGKPMKDWSNPYEDYIKSYGYSMANESDIGQGFLSGAVGGFILGGAPVALALGRVGAGIAAYNTATDGYIMPSRTEERREVSNQLDAVKYAKHKQLYLATGDERHMMAANRTMTGAAESGIVLNASSIDRFVGEPDKRYMGDIIRNITAADLKRAQHILPEPALAAMYNEIGQGDIAGGIMGTYLESQQMRKIPNMGSSIYNEEVPLTSAAIKTMEMRGLNAHDAGMGWYDQMAKLNRQEKMGVYKGESLYDEVGPTVERFQSDFNQTKQVRQILSNYASNVTIVDDGLSSINIEVIYR